MVDLGLKAVSHFHRVDRARPARVSCYPKAHKARARVTNNLKNARQFVKPLWMRCQLDLMRCLRFLKVLKLVDMANEGPKTHYLVSKRHISGDHGPKCDT